MREEIQSEKDMIWNGVERVKKKMKIGKPNEDLLLHHLIHTTEGQHMMDTNYVMKKQVT